MEDTARPHRRLRHGTILAVALFIVCTAIAIVANGRLDARFHRELASLEQAVATRSVADRPPTFGPGSDTDAWPAYERARKAGDDGESVLRSLVDGARANRVGRPVPRQRVEDAFGVEAVEIGSKTLTAARDALANGDVARAVELATAALRFARDLAATGPWIDAACGLHIADESSEVLAEIAAAATLSATTGTELATFVAAIDESWPTAEVVYDQEVLGSGLLLAQFADGDHSVFEIAGPLQLWRFGFSKSRFVAAWWDLAMQRRDALRALDGQDWSTAERALDAPPFTRTGDPRDIIDLALRRPIAGERATRARLRIVVTALHYRIDAAVPELTDPFDGNALRSRIDGARATIWSIGENGRDDAGLGSFDPDHADDIALSIAR